MLAQEAGLAHFQEEKLLNARRMMCHRFSPISSINCSPISQTTPSPIPPLHAPLLLPTPSKSPPTVPLKRLSPEKLTSWSEHGLCFNCDENFHHGYKCASR